MNTFQVKKRRLSEELMEKLDPSTIERLEKVTPSYNSVFDIFPRPSFGYRGKKYYLNKLSCVSYENRWRRK